VAEIAMV